MTLRPSPLVAALLCAAACATGVHAQAAPQAPPSQEGQEAAAPPATPQPPTKKVWTNEDMNGLDPHTGVSTVGKEAGKPAKPGPQSASMSKSHDAQWYKAQISKLQSQIPPLDAQIDELQSAIDGKPTGDAVKSTRPAGVKFDNWTNELADLKQKRDGILAHITALRDEARHNGVPANELP